MGVAPDREQRIATMAESGNETLKSHATPDAVQSRVALWNNVLSLVGFFLIFTSVMLLSTFVWFNIVAPATNPYVDVIGFLVLPGFLIIGLTLVPVGMFIKFKRVRRKNPGRAVSVRLRLDLDNREHRRRLIAFLVVSFIFVLPLVGVSSYHGYHYTDSTEFCAKVCHSVMEPQAVAHHRSAHARVTCAECHIGSGADWFVKSKLSGTRQIFRTMGDTFPRPIPNAITELRPARDTCMECHWPEKFHGSQLFTRVHYSADQFNTRREVRMLVKTGGADPVTGRIEGIHMHMALSGAVDYVAVDHDLQNIPWVKYTATDGTVTIFRSDGLTSKDPPPQGIVRRVDCMDCHNRSAHHFRPPDAAVNAALDSGQLDASVPFLKREAVAALSKEYADREKAEAGIRAHLEEFYGRLAAQSANLAQTGDEDWVIPTIEPARLRMTADRVVEIYRQNFFPEMKVNWMTYPDNVGHTESPGCMRCHDGLHVSDTGVLISSDCNTCHTFLNPLPERPEALLEGEFQHSMSLLMHPNLRCHQCHTGGPIPTCMDCHESGDWLDTRGRGIFRQTHPGPQRGPQ